MRRLRILIHVKPKQDGVYNTMGNLLKLLKLAPDLMKYLPLILEGIEIIKKLVELGKDIFGSDKETPEQEIEFKQQKDKLVKLVHDELPVEAKAFAKREELDKFTDKLTATADSAGEAIAAFIPLTKA